MLSAGLAVTVSLWAQKDIDSPADTVYLQYGGTATVHVKIGYGAHLVKSEDFHSQGLDSGQAYLQALDVFYRPFVWGSVHVGAAIGMDWFTIRDMLFIQDDDHNVLVAPFPEEDKEKDAKYRSSVREWTVMVPATLQFHFGNATVRLGAEALYSFSPKVRLDITKKDFREFTESKGCKIRNFGYDFVAAASFGHFGVFGKFRPAAARRFPDPGPTMSTWTVGVCLTTF